MRIEERQCLMGLILIGKMERAKNEITALHKFHFSLVRELGRILGTARAAAP